MGGKDWGWRAGASHCHMLGDEQLLPAAGLHTKVAVIDEQQLQEVLGELGSPSHILPQPQQLWERCRVGGGSLPTPPCVISEHKDVIIKKYTRKLG